MKLTSLKRTIPKQQLQAILLLVLVLLMLLLLPPPRPLASSPGQYRRNLLPDMAHGLKPLLRAHDLLLTHLLNSDTNHDIGIRRASRLIPLPLLCNDLLLISWPGNISWKRWQNLRVRHCIVPQHLSHPPCMLSCRLTPIGLLKSVSAEVYECLHNLRRCQLYNIRRLSRDAMDVSVLPQHSLRQVTVHLRTPHIIHPEYHKTYSKPWISLCSSYGLHHTSSN